MALWGCTVLAILSGSLRSYVLSSCAFMPHFTGTLSVRVHDPHIHISRNRLPDKHGTRWYVAVGYILTMISSNSSPHRDTEYVALTMSCSVAVVPVSGFLKLLLYRSKSFYPLEEKM
ncbi:hypothetical protein EMCG_06600 [[Emmonsia] crescens]|uniref:Uncharacterized protein n=1 Tax=[Emmonsia] crescens TaxID=73230 RepID=A0A0G2IB32_9EURO|nr:hypothetical protein EMCG_06600 [Emmonsia crescens UAMH 3008]